MAQPLQLKASISGGTLDINVFEMPGSKLLDSLALSDKTPNGQLNTALADKKSYLIVYFTKARKEGCVYNVSVTQPAAATAQISVTLHKGQNDFNAIPFHT